MVKSEGLSLIFKNNLCDFMLIIFQEIPHDYFWDLNSGVLVAEILTVFLSPDFSS